MLNLDPEKRPSIEYLIDYFKKITVDDDYIDPPTPDDIKAQRQK